MQAGKYKLFCVDTERRVYLIHSVKIINVIVVYFVLKDVLFCVSLLIQPIESGWLAERVLNLTEEALRNSSGKGKWPILCVLSQVLILSWGWDDDVFIFYIEMHFFSDF